MSTISVSLPSDGQNADVSDYNTPITTIVTEFNGNIDNSNIKDSAAITPTKIAFAKTTDANGWTKYDFGFAQMYAKTYTWTGSQSIAANGNYSLPSMNLPVGITAPNNLYVTATAVCNDRIFLVNFRNNTGSTIPWEVSNTLDSSITLTSVSIDVVAWSR